MVTMKSFVSQIVLTRLCRQQQTRVRFSSTAEFEPKKTCLYDLHVTNHGKMVNFAGWLLPVQYQDAITTSHQHTRTHASLFDVGHMLQSHIFGPDSCEFIESLTTIDLKKLNDGSAALTVFTNSNGGILDDLIVTKDSMDHYFIVSNAGRRSEDMEHLLNKQEKMKLQGKKINIQFLDPLEQGLIALQGPKSSSVLQSLVSINLSKLKFMNSVETELDKRRIRISRCGYTGEDGFEISTAAKDAKIISEMILEKSDVRLAGLGARDSLRLEAGLCLYGHDINENTTPVEATLSWLVAKRRRAEANFPGARCILEQIKNGTTKKRVGLTLENGPPARENTAILSVSGECVGKVTSGGPSPTLKKCIAMGYVPSELAKIGTNLYVEIRSKTYRAVVSSMPFIKSNYYTGN